MRTFIAADRTASKGDRPIRSYTDPLEQFGGPSAFLSTARDVMAMDEHVVVEHGLAVGSVNVCCCVVQ